MADTTPTTDEISAGLALAAHAATSPLTRFRRHALSSV